MEKTLHYRPTKAIIDLQAIQHNIVNLRTKLQQDVAVIAVVKANAYGHGDVQVAQAALQAGATILAVATPDEAIHLRRHFPTVELLVLGASPVEFAPYAAEHNITLTVFSPQWVQQAQQHLQAEHNVKLHIKIDSGMGRIGVTTTEQLHELLQAIEQAAGFIVDGMFTHFATADEEHTTYFDNQITKFQSMLACMPVKPRLVHVANTATAFIKSDALQYDAVRYGISLYGLAPSSYVAEHLPFALKPALSLETELVHVKRVAKGDSIGYGAAYTAEEDCYIGTLPIGYADGMVRHLSGIHVIVGGQLAPVVGRICMDQCMVRLPSEFSVGERVTLIGEQQGQCVTIDDWAAHIGTINYEIPCILTARVPRVYI